MNGNYQFQFKTQVMSLPNVLMNWAALKTVLRAFACVLRTNFVKFRQLKQHNGATRSD